MMFENMTSFNFATTSLTVQADRGALEGVVHGEGPEAGRQYNNQVLQLFRVVKPGGTGDSPTAVGKIQSLREWIDPFEVWSYIESDPGYTGPTCH